MTGLFIENHKLEPFKHAYTVTRSTITIHATFFPETHASNLVASMQAYPSKIGDGSYPLAAFSNRFEVSALSALDDKNDSMVGQMSRFAIIFQTSTKYCANDALC